MDNGVLAILNQKLMRAENDLEAAKKKAEELYQLKLRGINMNMSDE